MNVNKIPLFLLCNYSYTRFHDINGNLEPITPLTINMRWKFNLYIYSQWITLQTDGYTPIFQILLINIKYVITQYDWKKIMCTEFNLISTQKKIKWYDRIYMYMNDSAVQNPSLWIHSG